MYGILITFGITVLYLTIGYLTTITVLVWSEKRPSRWLDEWFGNHRRSETYSWPFFFIYLALRTLWAVIATVLGGLGWVANRCSVSRLAPETVAEKIVSRDKMLTLRHGYGEVDNTE